MIEIGGREPTGTAEPTTGACDEHGPAIESDGGPHRPADTSRARPGWPAVGLVVSLAVPFVVALVQLRSPTWYANLDLALAELRVRDVGTDHPPLVGPSGRFVWNGVPGSHPGALLFWLLAPLYRLFGSSSWAMEAASATLGFAAAVTAAWLGRRRAGRVGALAVSLGMVVLLAAYGPGVWTQPWNPYAVLPWWPVLLLAVWSVLCDDLAGLPAAVFAGSLCAQSHISYVGLVPVLVGVAVVVVVLRRRRLGAARVARWLGASALLLVVLWAPPLVEQVRNDPGNLSILRGHFFDSPPEPSVGLASAVEASLQRLDPLSLLERNPEATGSAAVGAVVLVAWLAAAVVAVRRPAPNALRTLHAVVGVALVSGLVAISRIQGLLYEYLVLWTWGTTVLAVAAIAWTVAAVGASPRASGSDGSGGSGGSDDEGDLPRRARLTAPAVLSAALAVALVVATWDAVRVDQPQPGQARINAELIPPAVAALQEGVTAGGDPVPGAGADDARYLVRSDDGVSGGLNSFTLLLALERAGLDAGVDRGFAVTARPHRVLDADDATAQVVFAVGPAIDEVRARPGAVEIAASAPTAADLEELDRLRSALVADLDERGLDDLVPHVDQDDLLVLGTDARLPMSSARVLRRMIEIGAPTAIFVTPVA